MRLRVTIPLSKLTLLPQGERFGGMFTVYLRTKDQAGDTTPLRYRTFPVSVPLVGIGKSFVYEVEMNLDLGPHEVAVGVRDELGGGTAYVKRTIEPGLVLAGG